MIDQQDQDVYEEVGAAFAEVHLGRDADEVMKRGRTLRRRRQAMPAMAVAGVLAVSLGVATVTSQSHSSSKVALVNVDEAAFSVHTNAKTGDVTVTIRELFDENQLKRVLAEAGIPAAFHAESIAVTSGDDEKHSSFCQWTGATALNPGAVLTHPANGRDAVFIVVPSAMPHGSVLAFNVATAPGAGSPAMASAQLLSNAPTGCVS
jgi:hypothetical protein